LAEAGVEQSAKSGTSQFNKTSDRLDKVEKRRRAGREARQAE